MQQRQGCNSSNQSIQRPEEFTTHPPVCSAFTNSACAFIGHDQINATARQKATAERAPHMEKNGRENAATLLAVPTTASTA